MKEQNTPGAIADKLFDRNDKQAEFWREYFKANQTGTVTKEMIHRSEQLLRQQDLAVKRFLNSMR